MVNNTLKYIYDLDSNSSSAFQGNKSDSLSDRRSPMFNWLG